MSVNLSLLAGAGWQFFTDDGVPLAGGLLYTYAAGTTTPQTTYTTSAGVSTNTNPIVLNSAGRLANEIWLTEGVSYKFVLKTAVAVQVGSYDDISGANDFSLLSAPSGSSLIGFLQAGTGAVATTVQTKLRTGVDVSVFDFMTTAEIAAVQAYTFVTSVQTACQAAIDAAYASKKNLFFPSGGYLVTGLIIPGTVDGAGTDDRDKGWRMYGQGFGEPFVHTNTGGTVIKSVTNAPVLADILGTASSSNGTIEIDHIRFDGTSTTPVVQFMACRRSTIMSYISAGQAVDFSRRGAQGFLCMKIGR